jgi:hypothetical protein
MLRGPAAGVNVFRRCSAVWGDQHHTRPRGPDTEANLSRSDRVAARNAGLGCAACPCLQDGAGLRSRGTQTAHGTARRRTSAVQASGPSLAHLRTAMGGNRRHWSALVGTYAARRSPARWADLDGHTSHWSRRTAVDRARTAYPLHQILHVLRQTLRHFMVSTKQRVESETEPLSQWRTSTAGARDSMTQRRSLATAALRGSCCWR